jgi:type IV fimbrial biogenesis protein FimT
MLAPAQVICRQRGFTLIEATIAIAIAALALTLGVPAFSTWLQDTQVRTVTDSIRDGLQVARNEALRRNCQVQFSMNYDTSWTVTAIVPGGPNVVVQARAAAEAASARVTALVKPNGTTPVATFDAFGRMIDVPAITEIDVSSTVAGTRMLRIQLKGGGQIRVCDPVIYSTTDPRYCQ